MTPLRELFKLYGLSALFPSTRLLHRRVEQLELENQMLEEKMEEERDNFQDQKSSFWKDYQSLQERIFVRKENLPPVKTDEQPVRITKKKASLIRDKIAAAKRNEIAYYQRLSEQQDSSQ
jgi:hypothetical protein